MVFDFNSYVSVGVLYGDIKVYDQLVRIHTKFVTTLLTYRQLNTLAFF